MKAWANQIRFLSFIFRATDWEEIKRLVVPWPPHRAMLCLRSYVRWVLNSKAVHNVHNFCCHYDNSIGKRQVLSVFSMPGTVLGILPSQPSIFMIAWTSWVQNFLPVASASLPGAPPQRISSIYFPVIADFWIQFLCSASLLGYSTLLRYTRVPLPLSFKRFLKFQSRHRS